MSEVEKQFIEKVELYTVDYDNRIDLRRKPIYLLGCNKERQDGLLVYFSVDQLEDRYIRKASLYLYIYSVTYRRQQLPTLIPYIITNNWGNKESLWLQIDDDTVDLERKIYHKGLYTMDITHMVRKWHQGCSNNGLLLRFKDHAQNTFIKVRGYMSGQQYNSKVSVEYGDPEEEQERILPKPKNQGIEEKEEKQFETTVLSKAYYIMENKQTTFFVKNKSSHQLRCQIQISPDGENYFNEAQLVYLDAEDIVALKPTLLAKYARIQVEVCNDTQGLNTCQIWYLAK